MAEFKTSENSTLKKQKHWQRFTEIKMQGAGIKIHL